MKTLRDRSMMEADRVNESSEEEEYEEDDEVNDSSEGEQEDDEDDEVNESLEEEEEEEDDQVNHSAEEQEEEHDNEVNQEGSEEEDEEANHSGEEQAQGEEQDEPDDDKEEMSGWADSMMKILNSTKPKNKKELMLSRARKDYEVSKQPTTRFKKDDDIEIAKVKSEAEDSADVKKEEGAQSAEDSNILSMKQQRKLELRQRKLERAWENLNRLTKEAPDKEMEVDLLKIATKGVVQLFNAVNQQQKSLKTKLRASSKSEFKKDKVLAQSKDLFDKAMSRNRTANESSSDEDDDAEIKKEETSSEDEQMSGSIKIMKRKSSGSGGGTSSKKPAWPALHDDFMLGAKLKDWDKDSDDD